MVLDELILDEETKILTGGDHNKLTILKYLQENNIEALKRPGLPDRSIIPVNFGLFVIYQETAAQKPLFLDPGNYTVLYLSYNPSKKAEVIF
ncbi:MAG: hypothetical protein Q8O88_01500 [bacterium]|nr:hypothetical protein [bacterium]